MTITASRPAAAPAPAVHTDRVLTVAGVLAGPLFIGTSLVQAFTRDGFDLQRHAFSLLSLGSLGWIQTTNFLVTGALLVLAGLRLRLVGSAGVWGPRLVAGYGTGMLVAGLFGPDPAYGFPIGTPDGPGHFSWHGTLHALGFMIAMVSWISLALVLARRFARNGERAWAAICLGTLALAAIIGACPLAGPISIRIALASAVELALVAALSVKAQRTS